MFLEMDLRVGLMRGVDFGRVFFVGDSVGVILIYYIICGVRGSGLDKRVGIEGIVLIYLYFWVKDFVGLEISDSRKEMDRWWMYVCLFEKGCDDSFINLFVDGVSSIDRVLCYRMFVLVVGDDILRE